MQANRHPHYIVQHISLISGLMFSVIRPLYLYNTAKTHYILFVIS